MGVQTKLITKLIDKVVAPVVVFFFEIWVDNFVTLFIEGGVTRLGPTPTTEKRP